MATRLAEASDLGTFTTLIPQWERSLRAANKSPRTVQSYGESARQLQAFLAESFGITEVAKVTREHLETFIEQLLAHWKPTTASVRFRSIQQLYKWLEEEGEVTTNPMAKMRPPAVPEVPVPVVSDDDLRKLLKACGGKTYEDLRDAAIIRLFCDTGCRLSEVAGLRVEDLDTDQSLVIVLGKGRRPRAALRRPHGPGNRPLRTCTLTPPSGGLTGAVADFQGRHDRWGHPTDVGEALPGGRHRAPPPAPAAAHLRPYLLGGRRQRNRPHEARWLAQSGDGVVLRCQRGR